MNYIRKYFKFDYYNTNFKTEIIGGIITFLSMCYILFVNPIILAPTKADSEMIFTGTALAAALGCILMGLLANKLLTIAPGMGLNTLFSATIGVSLGFSFEEILAILFITSFIHLILSISGFRTLISKSIPEKLKLPITIGICLFIAIVGLFNSGLLVASPDTIISLGSLKDIKVIITLLGIIFLLILVILKVNKAILYTLVFSIIISITFTLFNLDTGITYTGVVKLPKGLDLTLFIDGFRTLNIERGLSIFVSVFSILLLSIFNVQGTINATEDSLKIEDKDLKKIFLADSITMITCPILCTSPSTTFAETITGVEYGARTGFASIVCGLCFLISLFFSPLLSVITSQITAPILIYIGISMFKEIKHIDLDDHIIAISSFFIILFMPFTYSIINGMALGILIYTILKIISYKKTEGKKFKDEIPIFLILLCILFIINFIVSII